MFHFCVTPQRELHFEMFNNSSSFDHSTAVQCSIPIVSIYASIAVIGIVGNVNTCVVIWSNKSMHTATNCYLFNLAIADLIALVWGVPIYDTISYSSEFLCQFRALLAITSFYVAKLTVGVFSIERYLAICHPFLVKLQLSSVSRAIKAIFVIWLLGFFCALPGALKFMLVHQRGINRCIIFRKKMTRESLYAVGISSMTYFVIPVLVIGLMYARIGLTLRKSYSSVKSHNERSKQRAPKLLMAIVLAFVICWAPINILRILIILNMTGQLSETIEKITWIYLFHPSHILLYTSSLINPILYNIMSKKFRESFKITLLRCCRVKGGRISSTSGSKKNSSSNKRTESTELRGNKF